MPRFPPMLLASLVVLCLPPSAFAEGPFGAKPKQEAPPTDRVDTRFGALFPGDDLVRPEPEVEVPTAPPAFQARAQTCFEQSRERDPSYAGRLELVLTVASTRVVVAKADKNTTGDPVLAECVVERATGFSLPEAEAGDLRWVFVIGAR